MYTSVALAALAAPLLVAAHGHVSGVSVNGGSRIAGANPNWYHQPAGQAPKTPGWKAMNQDNGFVEPANFGSSDVACHKGATPGETYIQAKAGDRLKIYWDTWPDSHKGPIINYMAPCNGECTSASAGSLNFVKLSEAALISGSNPGTWVTDSLISNGFSSDFTIPSSVAPGNYVLRHEIIALHAAGNPNGAQIYPQCLNIKITSGGSNSLGGGTRGSSLYRASDPGILFSLYNSFSSYPIPGPALNGAGGGGGGGGGGNNGGGGGNNGGGGGNNGGGGGNNGGGGGNNGGGGGGGGGNGGCTVPQWQQCGGQNYNGCTNCASGLTCKAQNEYYSQCA